MAAQHPLRRPGEPQQLVATEVVGDGEGGALQPRGGGQFGEDLGRNQYPVERSTAGPAVRDRVREGPYRRVRVDRRPEPHRGHEVRFARVGQQPGDRHPAV